MKSKSTLLFAVMPFDVLGCTRVTLMHATSFLPGPMGLGNLFKLHRDGDRALQLLLLNEEFLVIAGHQPAMITSLPFSLYKGLKVTCFASHSVATPSNCREILKLQLPSSV